MTTSIHTRIDSRNTILSNSRREIAAQHPNAEFVSVGSGQIGNLETRRSYIGRTACEHRANDQRNGEFVVCLGARNQRRSEGRQWELYFVPQN